MRQYRAVFRAQRQEANQHPHTCRACRQRLPPEAFYRPRQKPWMPYQEFFWTLCKPCHREAVRAGVRSQPPP